MDRNIYFQFEGHASLFSEESTPKHNALISGGDEQTLKIIMSTAIFDGENHTFLKEPNFLFGDRAPDTYQ